jgi:hypothetical protein
MKFKPFIEIETLVKCYILKILHVIVENLICFYKVLTLYIVKREMLKMRPSSVSHPPMIIKKLIFIKKLSLMSLFNKNQFF